MKMTLRFAFAFALAPLACGNESAGLPTDLDGGADGSQADRRGTDAAPDLTPDLPPDLPPDLAPDLPPPVPCKPTSSDKAAVCGSIYRGATLPFIPADPRADGKGALIIIPFACNPLAPEGDPDACAMKGPPAIGTAVTI